MIAIIFQSPTVRAADPDSDGDGLSDAVEGSVLYVQSAGVTGLPTAIPDSGVQPLYATTAVAPWTGSPAAVVARIDLTHYSRTDLVIVVGSWTGSGWDDRVVYDPAGRAPSGIPASVTHTHTRTTCRWIEDYYHCWSTSYTETHSVVPVQQGGQATFTVETSYSPTSPGVSSGTPSFRMAVDLVKPVSLLTASEVNAGIKAPTFHPDDFRNRGTWRVIVMDFVPGSSGTLTGVALRWEGRSDPWTVDSDGDRMWDGTEVLQFRSVPVAVDSDVDGIRDDLEAWSYWITVRVDGSSYSGWVATDPTRWDSDADGLGDGQERNLQTHPLSWDTDYDWLGDGAEVATYGSSPNHRDSDSDSLSDDFEVYARTLVLAVNGGTQYRTVTTLPYAEDTDGDGLRDNQEWWGSSVYGVRTDPSDADTDDDGLPDGQERYVKEYSLSTRKTVGTGLWVPLSVSVSGPIERVDVRYGLSSIDVSNFYVSLNKDGRWVVLRNRQGSGSVAYGSADITHAFAHGGAYGLYVWSAIGGGILEEFALSFTLRTSPILTDTDWDGLNDGEEVTYGADAWITDPNRYDTDGDYWSDGYESLTRGTNPLAWDTDGDGAGDPWDLDPLRNLLVAVRVNRIHHGASPWCTPELVGIVRVNDAYTWVTEHRMATEDRYWSWGCWADIASTASFYYTYYADVPDDQPWVSVRGTAWGINPGRGDDILVDQYVGYHLGWGAAYYNLWGGNSWYSFDVWTVALPKARTLLITNDDTSVTASNGQTRLMGQDRYFVLTIDATYAYGPIGYGVNTIVVPRSIFLDTKLKADFDAGYHWPLGDAPLYGEDRGRSDISEGVAGVIAKRLPGWDANNVLDRLVRNAQNAQVYRYVDITSYALLVNLPADVVRILPWVGVWNGPTGAMPADFWQKIGAAASAVVNSLVQFGQMIYKGLVALGTFLVNLSEAIWEWGIRGLGAVRDTIAGAVEAAGRAVQKLMEYVFEFIESLVKDAIDVLLRPVFDLLARWAGDFRTIIERILRIGDTDAEDVVMLDTVLFGGQVAALVAILATGIQIAIGLATMASIVIPGAQAVSAIFKQVILAALKSAAEHWLASTLLVLGAGAIIGAIIPKDSPAWGLASAIGTLIVTLLTSILQGRIGTKLGIDTTPLDADRKGLILSLLGFFLSIALVASGASGVWAVIGAWAGAVLAGTGLLVLVKYPSWNDMLPVGLGYVDELIGAAAFGFSLGVALTTQ